MSSLTCSDVFSGGVNSMEENIRDIYGSVQNRIRQRMNRQNQLCEARAIGQCKIEDAEILDLYMTLLLEANHYNTRYVYIMEQLPSDGRTIIWELFLPIHKVSLMEHLICRRKKESRMPEVDVLKLLWQFLFFLKYLHYALRVAHGFLTPSNTFVDDNRGEEVLTFHVWRIVKDAETNSFGQTVMYDAQLADIRAVGVIILCCMGVMLPQDYDFWRQSTEPSYTLHLNFQHYSLELRRVVSTMLECIPCSVDWILDDESWQNGGAGRESSSILNFIPKIELTADEWQ